MNYQNEINIENKIIGNNQPCYIIAEIGVNHNGDLILAKKLIDAAIESGVDAVKFQKRTIDLVYSEKEYVEGQKKGKEQIEYLDRIRGTDIKKILGKNKKVLEWWTNI